MLTRLPLLIAAALTLIFIHPITDLDIWWHLDSGQWMWQHHTLLTHEIRSFTAPQADWVNVHWSFQLLLAAFYNGLGDWGLLLLKGGLVLLLFYGLALTNISTPAHLLAFITSVLLVSHYVVGHLFLRPHLLSYLYFISLIALFSRPFQRQHLLWFAGLLLLWANSHLSAIVGTTAVIVHLLVNPQVPFNSPLQRIAVSLSFAILPFCSPFTTDILTALFSHSGGPALHYISEWSPTAIYPAMLWGLFWLALLQQCQRFNPGELFLLVFFAWQSSKHGRFEGELALLLIRPTTHWLYWGYQTLKAVPLRFAAALPVLFFALLNASLLYLYGAPMLWTRPVFNEFPVAYSKYPEATVATLKTASDQAHRPLKVLNEYGWGGFLAQRLKQSAQIFIDGRTPLIFNDTLMLEHQLASLNPLVLLKLADYYQLDALLLESTPNLPLPPDHPDWQLVAYDPVSLLYLKRPLLTEALPRIDYNPQQWPVTPSPHRLQATQTLLKFHPANPLALLHLALMNPDPQQKHAELQQAHAINPDYTLVNLLLAESWIQHQHPAEALPLLDAIPLRSNRELWTARLYLSADHPQQAQTHLYPPDPKRRAELESRSLELWLLRSLTACALHQLAAARQAFDMAYLLAPPDQTESLQQLQRTQTQLEKAGCSG